MLLHGHIVSLNVNDFVSLSHSLLALHEIHASVVRLASRRSLQLTASLCVSEGGGTRLLLRMHLLLVLFLIHAVQLLPKFLQLLI